MSKIRHTSLNGTLVWDEATNEHRIDGFSVPDVLYELEGSEVHFEIIAQELPAPPSAPLPEPVDEDFMKRLLGGD